ncbi:MAG: SRPBCC domain-containing protein [Pseudolabrys sp.]
MIDISKFRPKTVYVTYIASTPEKVRRALTDPVFTRQYFFGFAVDVEPKIGGAFRLLAPDGHVHVRGQIVDRDRRFISTWVVEGMQGYSELPECLVGYEIEQSGEAVRLTMIESHSWDVPEAILKGGQTGWPKILSSLKSVLETGNPVAMKMEGPPPGMTEAVQKALAEKPWLK